MTPHPDFPRFLDVLKNHPTLFISWKGGVFRQTLPRWASLPYRFTGVGAALAGGRWSVRHLIPAVHGSTDLSTLGAEAYYLQARIMRVRICTSARTSACF